MIPRRALPVLRCSIFAAVLAGLMAPASANAQDSYTLFESGHVRPLAMSPDGRLLFAVNTPDNRLEVFRANHSGLQHRASIPVGLEPVAVAARNDGEVWVVNHLSDSVSIIELTDDGDAGRVVRTLLVGDEPRDIVFAGPGKRRAFITTAHRGQNVPYDPQLTTPGIGRADVWVFDAHDLGDSLEGEPLTILNLFTDTPRALAVTPDGTRVYAAGFHTGNRTTTLFNSLVPDGFEAAGGVPDPSTNVEGIAAPEQGLIVKHNGAHWVDEIGRVWDDQVRFSLPDKDVFAINAMASPPELLAGPSGTFAEVGTVLFDMAVNPVSGKVYVANTDALNLASFEGPGVFGGRTLRGHLHESRITVLGSGGSVLPRHLNKHIDYSSCCAPVPNAENAKSLAQPMNMVVTKDGATLYVSAHGSSKVGVYSTAAIENDTFVPSTANQITVTGGGPTGLVLDENEHRLYVLTRFDNSISIVNTATKTETTHIPMHTPEPPSVVIGRRFLYDAAFTSSHGDSACASCHVFGDLDSLAWNLGNPDDVAFLMPGPFIEPGGLINHITGEAIVDPIFHPMKGPMATQSLRGMANHGSMHWRGDRTAGVAGVPSVQPDGGTFDERGAFEKFQGGFTNLLGRSAHIPVADMEAFTDFVLQITYPPNPIRNLDNSLTVDQQIGKDNFFNRVANGFNTCEGCHTTDPDLNPGDIRPGSFGTLSFFTFDFQPQLFKVPHLRNMYQKVGMFGMPETPFIFFGSGDFTGDQVRGFGFTHDGSVDTMFRFVSAIGFSSLFGNPEGIPVTPEGDVIRRQIESFLLAFDSNMAPVVGQQVTLTKDNEAVAGPRIDLFVARAEAGECDLIAKARIHDEEAGFLYVGAGHFIQNRQGAAVICDEDLRDIADHPKRELTYTCSPPGSGERIGVDRDGDGHLDGDEQDAGSDPADPSSTP